MNETSSVLFRPKSLEQELENVITPGREYCYKTVNLTIAGKCETSSCYFDCSPSIPCREDNDGVPTKYQEKRQIPCEKGKKRSPSPAPAVLVHSQKRKRTTASVVPIAMPITTIPREEEQEEEVSPRVAAAGSHYFSFQDTPCEISVSNDEVVAQLAEELMGYVSPTPSVVEATPIPLLTPPASPVSSKNLEWPSNLAVDNALTAAANKLHPPSLSSLAELEEDCESSREPFVQIVFPRNWHNAFRLKH